MTANGSKALFALNCFMGLVFLLCAAVQYNDPDPIRWMMVYGAATVCCILFALKKLPRLFPMITGIAALVWALSILPRVIGKNIPFDQVFGTIHMISETVEETREIGGLLIVAVWMAILVNWHCRRITPLEGQAQDGAESAL